MICIFKGIDVSKYQKDINWNRVKNDGINFAMVRASLGSYTADPLFESHISGAQSAGLHVGAYHYFYATTVDEAVEEARFFLSCIKNHRLTFPVAVDVEESAISHVGKSQLTDAVIAFCEALEDAGYYICVYANTGWLNHYLDSARLKPYDLWLAHWDISDPSRQCGMWQYTSKGSVDGIVGCVDMNYAYKDYPGIISDCPSDIPEHIPEKIGTFNGKYVYIRSRPSFDSSILRSILNGDYFSITGEADGWYEIAFAQVNKGYIPKSNVTVSFK